MSTTKDNERRAGGLFTVLLAGAGLWFLAAWWLQRSTAQRALEHIAAQSRALEAWEQRSTEVRDLTPVQRAGMAWAARDLPALDEALRDARAQGFAADLMRSQLARLRSPASEQVRALAPSGAELLVEKRVDAGGYVVRSREYEWEVPADRPITALTCDEEGHLVAAVSGGEVWVLAGGEESRTVTQHRGTVHALALRGEILLSAGYDEVIVGTTLAGRELFRLEAHRASVQALTWIDDDRFASGDLEGRIICWRRDPDLPMQGFELGEAVRALEIAKDGRHLVYLTASARLGLWPFEGGLPVHWRVGRASVARASTAPGKLVAVGLDGQAMELDTEAFLYDGGERLDLGSGSVLAMASSPGRPARFALGGSNERVRIVDLESEQEEQDLRAHRRGVSAVAWSTDGRLATSGADQKIRIFAGDGAELLVLPGHGRPVRQLAWLAEGDGSESLVSVGMDGSLRHWRAGDFESGEPGFERAGPRDGGVQCFELERGGERLVWMADGGNLRRWDVRNGSRRGRLRLDDLLLTSSVAACGNRIAVGTRFEEGRLEFLRWDGARRAASGFVGAVGAMAFAPEAEVLAAVSSRGWVSLYDPGLGLELMRLRPGFVAQSVGFAMDGRYLVLGGEGEIVWYELGEEQR